MYNERIDFVRSVQITIISEPYLLYHTMNQDIYKLYVILIVTRQITTELQYRALV